MRIAGTARLSRVPLLLAGKEQLSPQARVLRRADQARRWTAHGAFAASGAFACSCPLFSGFPISTRPPELWSGFISLWFQQPRRSISSVIGRSASLNALPVHSRAAAPPVMIARLGAHKGASIRCVVKLNHLLLLCKRAADQAGLQQRCRGGWCPRLHVPSHLRSIYLEETRCLKKYLDALLLFPLQQHMRRSIGRFPIVLCSAFLTW
jgi:hypothetical protein